MMKVLSLFANVGVAEAYLKKIGVNVVVANEYEKRRAALYSEIYPETSMICGDIRDKNVVKKIVSLSKNKDVDVIMATPPCQGMSTAGRQDVNDERNNLIESVVEIVKKLRPKYVFIENVPGFYSTLIQVNSKKVTILNYIVDKLSKEYYLSCNIIDTQHYSVPQRRERAITLLSRKDMKHWEIPRQDKQVVTMFDAIGSLPDLDPYIKDVSERELLEIFPHFYEKKERAEKISFWHKPPSHLKRQVVAMQHTPTGQSAFDNEKFFPTKADGSAVKGYHNTYARQKWDAPAYTVTMDNVKISSQNNVHPGRPYETKNGEILYSDARTLTLFEIMKIMTIPPEWPVPHKTSEAFLRRIIGEGIPPLFVKKVFENLLKIL